MTCWTKRECPARGRSEEGETVRRGAGAGDLLARPLLERAIGVIDRPGTERASQYFRAVLAAQFDAVIHFDETRALEPLDINPAWETEKLSDGNPRETDPAGREKRGDG